MLTRQKWLLQKTKIAAKEVVVKMVLLYHLDSIEKLFVMYTPNLLDGSF